MVTPGRTRASFPSIVNFNMVNLSGDGDGVEAAGRVAGAAFDALVLVDLVYLLALPGDGVGGAGLEAGRAARALVGQDIEADQLLTGLGRALALQDVGPVLLGEVFHGGEHRVGGGLPQAAESGVLDRGSQLLQGGQVLLLAPPSADVL